MFFWVAKKSKFLADKKNGDLTEPIPTVLLLCQRAMYIVFLLIYCKLKTNFIANSQIYIIPWGVRLRESVNKRKIEFSFSRLSASTYERVSAYGNV